MRLKALLAIGAIGALGVAGLAMAAPAASATVAEDDEGLGGRVVEMTVEEARPVCRGTTAATSHTTSCRKAAPGAQFRAGIDCTNTGWRNGPWRKQTTNFSTQSTVTCGAGGGTAQRYRIQFR